ncbi:squalene epoxidase-domain-containing protein [Staphylotrichum tortipilum]|uniref:squalene monooxygenase n=1 Tax=Staphylotrichum tortipilum TaxID=2831512 RepID=A0AAN6MEE2_9PEZI|nr:squalene epoxidase-domain-containing protein [Staphylotrichum longicolle]
MSPSSSRPSPTHLEFSTPHPNVTLLETTAVEILRDKRTGAVTGAVCSRLGNPPHEYQPLVILADGGTSNFRSEFTPHRPKAQSSFWALEMTDVKLPRHGYAYGVLGAAPPILIYQISARQTRILIDIPDTTHQRLGSNRAVRAYIRNSIIPIVPSSVRPSLEKAIEEGRLRSMPNAWLPHPVTGAGMTVALKDAVLLAELLSPKNIPSLADSGAVLKALRSFHWKRKAHSAILNILAQALYLLFLSEDPALGIMQRGFINYVQQGEKYFAEPAWLMGGVIDAPLLLFYHFFRVTLHSIALHLRQASALCLPAALFQSMVFQGAGRGTLDILFANFLALFVCVWTFFFRKCRWATLAVAAPKMLTVMQWNAANISVKQMQALGAAHWTRIHAFYANAGGFVLQTPDFPAFPINATSIHYLCSRKRIDVPQISRDDIWDRSNADHFAKGFAFIQAGWTLLQIVARRSQQLTVAPIEVFPAAFVLPSLVTAYFWASKPQNVAEPTVIRVRWTIADLLLSAGDAARDPYVDTPLDFVEKPVWDGWRRRPSLLHYGGLNTRPLPRIPNDYSPPPPTGTEATIVWVVSVAHAGPHKMLWRASSLTLLAVMAIGGLVPVLSTGPWFDFSFSMLWIWVREARKGTFARRWLFSLPLTMYSYASLTVSSGLHDVVLGLGARQQANDGDDALHLDGAQALRHGPLAADLDDVLDALTAGRQRPRRLAPVQVLAVVDDVVGAEFLEDISLGGC